MKNRKTTIILIVVTIFFIGLIIKSTFFQPLADDLRAGITEVAKYRNENNTGPIQYVFIATIKDTLWADLEIYGNYKPHHKGGNTKVYYFMEGAKLPLKPGPGKVNFDPAYNAGCIALYEKSAMGNVSLKKYPY
jgi:hypothetical protein